MIFTELNSKKGVLRTVDELIWAVQTFGQENPQVGVVGENIERLFQGTEPGELVNNYEIKFKKLLLKFQEKENSEIDSETEIDLSVSKIEVKPNDKYDSFLFEDSFNILKIEEGSPEMIEINKRRFIVK